MPNAIVLGGGVVESRLKRFSIRDDPGRARGNGNSITSIVFQTTESTIVAVTRSSNLAFRFHFRPSRHCAIFFAVGVTLYGNVGIPEADLFSVGNMSNW